jgi:aromatic-L-amino-acid decarboxylase
MTDGGSKPAPAGRQAPLEMNAEEFRAAGHAVVDRLAEFLATQAARPVAPGLSPEEVRALLGADGAPELGTAAGPLLEEAARLLLDNSTLSGHPRFLAYVVSSPSPIGALADLMAAVVNPNVGAWDLAPMATEIEAQSVRWIAGMLGYPTDCGGLLTSGGNMANFVGFLAARRAKAPWDVRVEGAGPREGGRLAVYTSAETHTWVQKAADLFGLGTGAIRWVATDDGERMDVDALRRQIREDRSAGWLPFLVAATGGTVSTGAVDPLPRIAAICKDEGLWFHVDGAYGGFAAAIPGAPEDLRGLALADSVAVDPHKWLYAPLEAGCALVRRREDLRDTFEYRPSYYHLREEGAKDEAINYYQYGPQNSRGFRALKVWLGLRLAGQRGYRRMIADDMALARALFEAAERDPELEAFTVGLSVTTFRYVPEELAGKTAKDEEYLDRLNTELLTRLQQGGEVYLSNAVVRGRFVLRSCIVNFRTTAEDIDAVPEIVTRVGRQVHQDLKEA